MHLEVIMRRIAPQCAAALLACLFILPSAAQQLPAGVKKVTTVEGITEYRLANGLQVLLFPDPSKQTITVNITYLVGSKHENYGETGMAHLLEHLVFKGTPKHQDIPKEFNQYGARFNGTTWYDRTNYYESFPATEEALRWALDLEADRMVNSHIAKKDLDSEMTVVRNEFEMGENSPNRVLLQRVMSTAYLWHNYGKSTIGAKSDVENVPIDRLQAFYRKHYQPDNAVLVVAGKFDEAKTLGWVVEKFGGLPKPDRKLDDSYTVEPTQDGERFVTLRRVGDNQLVMAGYHIPPGAHADFAAIDILARVLGDVPSGRLHKALVESKKAAQAGAFEFQLREPGFLLAQATLRKEQSLDDAKATLLQTLDSLAANPITKDEVERARTAILKDIDLSLNDAERIALGLTEWASLGDWRLFFLHRDRVKKVTVEDVQRVAKAYLQPSNRTLGVFIPEDKPVRAEIPGVPNVAEMLKDYKGSEAVAAGEAFDPSPANIEKRTQRSELFGGKLRLTLLPKQTRGKTVHARLSLHFGDETNLKDKSAVGALAGGMLDRGTTKRTRQQIRDELDRLKTRAYVAGTATGATASIETTRENLPAAMKLVAEMLREPAFPETEFEQLKQQRLAAVESGKSEPQQLAFTAINRHLSRYPKGDVRYAPTPEEMAEMLRAVTLADAKAFHQQFYGLAKAELTVVGDHDPQEVKDLASTLLAGWNSSQKYAEIRRPYQKVEMSNQMIEAPDKANAVFVAGVPLQLSDNDPDFPALSLGNFLLGGSFGSRFVQRIRHKDGLSYGVQSMASASSRERSGQFMTFAITNPQNVLKVEAAWREEIERALKDGFTPEEMKTAKAAWLQGRQVSRAQDQELVGRLATQRFYDRTMAWEAELERKVEALTSDDVVAALRKYIDPAQVSVFKAGDFKKAGLTK
ncbi:MAG: pitrilysin family protein [Bryobacteraceae bacterium]|nr:pitrilysin family protein [Bryobacteraceae bacterium]